MRLAIAASALATLCQALASTPNREIGGVLVGQHRGDGDFVILDLSVQITEGTRHHFVRDPVLHQPFLDAFFARTEHNYATFNYLGEWHSHVRVAPVPSAEDIDTMQALVANPAANAALAVLLIARGGRSSRIELSTTVFRDRFPHEVLPLTVEGAITS